MTELQPMARLLARAPELARLVRRFGKSIEEVDVLVKLATASRVVNPELAAALAHRFHADARRLERVLAAEVAAGRLAEHDARELRRVLDSARRRLAEGRAPARAQPALPPTPPRRPLTPDDIADPKHLRQRSAELVDKLRRELDRATMEGLDRRLTHDDWDAILRDAVGMPTPSVSNLKGLVQELYTRRLPAFRTAVDAAKKQFDAFTGREGWRFEVWHGIQALDVAGERIRDFADKGAFAVLDGPPMNWAIPLMFWEDKNESNVRDLLGPSGQVARLDVRAGHGLIRYGGKDYFVSEQIMNQLFPRVYGAAPALPGAKGLATLPANYRAVTRIYKTPLSSAALADVAKRVFRFVGR